MPSHPQGPVTAFRIADQAYPNAVFSRATAR